MASSLLAVGLIIFSVFSVILFVLAPYFLKILNLGEGFSPSEMKLMASLMRVIIFGQLLFIIGTFFSALLQSYNHFFIPGIAAALYNLGIIVGIVFLSSNFGIFAPAYGMVIGALFFIFAQVPMIKKVGFSFKPSILRTEFIFCLLRRRISNLKTSSSGSSFLISLNIFMFGIKHQPLLQYIYFYL